MYGETARPGVCQSGATSQPRQTGGLACTQPRPGDPELLASQGKQWEEGLEGLRGLAGVTGVESLAPANAKGFKAGGGVREHSCLDPAQLHYDCCESSLSFVPLVWLL